MRRRCAVLALGAAPRPVHRTPIEGAGAQRDENIVARKYSQELSWNSEERKEKGAYGNKALVFRGYL